MKRILASLAALFLIPCLPLAFVAVSQAAAPQDAAETNNKAEPIQPVTEEAAKPRSHF